MKTSKVHEFNTLSIDERIRYATEFAKLDDKEASLLYNSFGVISKEYADRMIENCICGNPLTGLVTNAEINCMEYLIPLSLEEPSVIAGASRVFKIADSVDAKSLGNRMKGQIYLTDLEDVYEAESVIKRNKMNILELVNKGHKYTRADQIETEIVDDGLVLYLVVDTGDIQGANTINKMCESVAPYLEEKTKGCAVAKIISNYGDECLVRGKIKIKETKLGRGDMEWKEAAGRFLKVARLAEKNIYRATTNNKGIMNGIIGVANATGQDTRAMEAAAHSYACRNGSYTSLSKWYKKDGYLVGELEIPMPVGIVRGASEHPYHRLGLKMLGITSAEQLQEVLVSVGLANNFSGIHEIATVGITEGHMRLHEKRFG